MLVSSERAEPSFAAFLLIAAAISSPRFASTHSWVSSRTVNVGRPPSSALGFDVTASSWPVREWISSRPSSIPNSSIAAAENIECRYRVVFCVCVIDVAAT